ncbi:MAG: hypothetical protein AB9922_06650 [Bacteroidales bacterium]
MKKSILLPLILLLIGFTAAGQTVTDTIFESAERLRRGYRFNEAIEIYKEILSQTTDSLKKAEIGSLIAKSENGLNMLQYASHPLVTGKITVPLSEFVLYYPGFKDCLWTIVPKVLNNRAESAIFPNYITYHGDETTIYYPARNEKGDFDLYRIRQVDSNLWSIPEPLNNLVNSDGDEMFPLLSRDGRQLFFSSTGHFGIGGFDLYVSYFDDKTNDWGLPQNLGFPYSSVDNDLLLVNSEDGLYTYFASDRNRADKDSIDLYRLDYEVTPVKRALTSTDEVLQLAGLNIRQTVGFTNQKDKREVMTSPETDEYKQLLVEVRKIQKEIDSTTREISANRAIYSTLSGNAERSSMENKISLGELSLLEMQARLTTANQVVQKREMEFLTKGTLIPRRDDFFKEIENKTVSETAIEPFIIKSVSPGIFPEIRLLEPVVMFDYTFSIGDEAVMAENHEIPDGLIYRIQLFSIANQADLKSFKGIRPVFENRSPSGRWIYSAGQFYSYNEAVDALLKIKRLGFSSAIITPFNDGKPETVKMARELEQKIQQDLTYQIKIEGYPAGMPQPVLDIIRQNTDRDIAKKTVDGRELFIIGPFTNKPEAENVIKLLEGVGASGLSLEEIKKTL